MRRIALTLIMICAMSMAQAQLNLVPKPLSANRKAGAFTLPETVEVSYSSPSLQATAEYLCHDLRQQSHLNATVRQGQKGHIRLVQGKVGQKDGYELTVAEGGITLRAANAASMASGIATLRQMVLLSPSACCLPAVSIKDGPRFAWRGFHLDCSRHFFTRAEVEEVIDLMALYKLNRFHWHLTDDQGWRIEIKKYPLLTERGAWRRPNNQDSICLRQAAENDNPDMLLPTDRWRKATEADGTGQADSLYGGYYTQDDIRAIVAYAKARGIEVVPEIDMPGHFLSAIEQYDGLSCFPEIGWGEVFTTPLCPGKDRMLRFCEGVWDEVVQLFPYEYVHVGGDEVPKDNWKRCPDCQRRISDEGLKDEDELQAWFIHRMERYLNQKGKKMLGWDEILEGGLSPTATVTWWRTWVPDAVSRVTAQGNDVIYCPGDPFYLNSPEQRTDLRSIYEYDLQPQSLTARQRQHVIGVQGNLWAEWVPTRARILYMYFPRMLAVSELAWTPATGKDFEAFHSRLTDQFGMLHRLNVPYHTPALEGFNNLNAFVSEGTLHVSCPDPTATVRYTTDGTFPNAQSALYTGPVTVDETTNFTLRTFDQEGRPGDMTRAYFVKQGYLEALPETSVKPADGHALQPGLTAEWHNYRGETCREVAQAPMEGRYEVDDVRIPDGVKGNIGLIITGYINVLADGVYTFALMSDDGSWLKIDGNMVVDNDRPQSPHEEICQQALRKGLHRLEARYFDSNGGMLRLWVIDEQGQRLAPASIYLH